LKFLLAFRHIAADPTKKEAKPATSPPAYRIPRREELTRKTLRFRFLREHRSTAGDVLIRKSQIATAYDLSRWSMKYKEKVAIAAS
jgi:hypothetical protein